MRARSIEALRPLPHDDALGPPEAEAARITRASGTSFGAGMAILPKPRRAGMWALYAFSRIIDDIADEDWPLGDKHRLLDEWREEVHRLYRGAARSTIARALERPVADYDLPKREFLLLIDGMQMDADGPIVAPEMAKLRQYTRRAAGAVGMLSMRIFGAWRGAVSARFALALGDALQLTNILRDIEEDAALGRLYLPCEMLTRHDIPADPRAVIGHHALPALAREIGLLARAEFDAARILVCEHERRAVAPALVMMGVYEGYLNRMARQGYHRRPLGIGRGAKLSTGLRAVVWPAGSRGDV